MTLYRLDASIRTEGSVTRAVADTVMTAWEAGHPDAAVIRRDIGTAPLPADAWRTAVSAGWTPADQLTPAQRSATALAAGVVDELVAAEAYVFAVPLYNYGVPQHFKAWADLVLTDPRTAPGKETEIAGRPAVLVTARGGGYAPGTPREGWDHATPWVRRFLADIMGLDLEVVEAELTLAPVTPAMEGLRDLAAASLAAAHTAAAPAGQTLVSRVTRAGAAA
jgi:FMN-dependent NADH-azoreductase